MTLWTIAADAVLVAHVLFVAFVVAGLALIYVGAVAGWRWVRVRAFRLAHLAAIGIVVAQAWLGVACPLTVLEMALRARAGTTPYAGSFIAHWLDAALYHSAPAWAFVAAYTAFGTAVVASWFAVRPRAARVRGDGPSSLRAPRIPRSRDRGRPSSHD